jgi:hypothetical protein
MKSSIVKFINDGFLQILKIHEKNCVKKYIFLCICKNNAKREKLKNVINEFIKREFIFFIILSKIINELEEITQTKTNSRVEIISGGANFLKTVTTFLFFICSLKSTVGDFFSQFEGNALTAYQPDENTKIVIKNLKELEGSNKFTMNNALTEMSNYIVDIFDLDTTGKIIKDFNAFIENSNENLTNQCNLILGNKASIDFLMEFDKDTRPKKEEKEENEENEESNMKLSTSFFSYFTYSSADADADTKYKIENYKKNEEELKFSRFINHLCSENIPKLNIQYETTKGIIGFDYPNTNQLFDLLNIFNSDPNITEDEHHIVQSLFEYNDKIQTFLKKNINKNTIEKLKKDLSKVVNDITLPVSVISQRKKSELQLAQSAEILKIFEREQEANIEEIKKQTKMDTQLFETEKKQNLISQKMTEEWFNYYNKKYDLFTKSIGYFISSTGSNVLISPLLNLTNTIIFSPTGAVIIGIFILFFSIYINILSLFNPLTYIRWFSKKKNIPIKEIEIVSHPEKTEIFNGVKIKYGELYVEINGSADYINKILNKSILKKIPNISKSKKSIKMYKMSKNSSRKLPKSNSSKSPKSNSSKLPKSISSKLPKSISSKLPKSISSKLPKSISSKLSK